MIKKVLSFISIFLLISCTDDRDFPEIENPILNPEYELVHYWDFNDASSSSSLIAPTYSAIGNPSLVYEGSFFDDVSEGSSTNIRLSSEAGSALRLRNPSGPFIMNLPTTGFKDVILTYATTRTGSGSITQTISYSLDGTNFIQSDLSQTEFTIFEDVFVLIQLNFTDIEGANNNPNFKIKVEFDEPSSTIDNGNNRIDNLTLDGIPTEDTTPPDTTLYLLHYWNFNEDSTDDTLITPSIGNGDLAYLGNYFDSVSPGSATNARNEDQAGLALRLRNQSGDFIISAPTNGHQNILLKYAATRTGSGSQTQTIFYSIDGTNYTQNGLTVTQFTLTEDIYNLYEIDFSSIQGVNNNPNFKVKVVFDQASSTITNGNNRFDNITVEGNIL